jgi:hypothetical protein
VTGTVSPMARLFRPERVEYDMVTANPDPAQSEGVWTTAAVDAVTPGALSGIEALYEYAVALTPRLRDFAEHITAPRGDATPTQRYNAYQNVRAMIRDKDGLALAEIRADGRVLLPKELDVDLRSRLNGLVNVGLPMVSRSVDQGAYENALESLMKARSVVNATLQAVLTIAVSAPDPPPREKLAAALKITPQELDRWFAGRTG